MTDLMTWLEKSSLFPKFCWVSPERTFAAAGARGIHRTMSTPTAFAYSIIPFEGEGLFIEPDEMREGSLLPGGAGVDLEPIDSYAAWEERFAAAKAAPYDKVVISRRFSRRVSSAL